MEHWVGVLLLGIFLVLFPTFDYSTPTNRDLYILKESWCQHILAAAVHLTLPQSIPPSSNRQAWRGWGWCHYWLSPYNWPLHPHRPTSHSSYSFSPYSCSSFSPHDFFLIYSFFNMLFFFFLHALIIIFIFLVFFLKYYSFKTFLRLPLFPLLLFIG